MCVHSVAVFERIFQASIAMYHRPMAVVYTILGATGTFSTISTSSFFRPSNASCSVAVSATE